MILAVGRQTITPERTETWLFSLASGASTIYRITLDVSRFFSNLMTIRETHHQPLRDTLRYLNALAEFLLLFM